MRSVLVAVALAALAACGTREPLPDSFESPDALGGAVLEAFRAGDRERLDRLALDEQQFRQRVWPELPAARPERNLPFSYVWGDLHQKSTTSLQALLARHRGHAYTLVSVSFGERTPYQTYAVHRDSVFRVRTGDGQEEDVRFCGSMIEQDGRWKVFSYVVDD